MGGSAVTRWPRSPLAAVLVSGSAVAVAAGIWLGGDPPTLPGLPDAGQGTAVALPVARLVHDVLAVGTVGALVLDGVLLPGRRREESAAAGRVAAWSLGWAVATAVWALLGVSDLLGVPIDDIPRRGSLASIVLSSPLTLAQLSTVWLAVLVALVARARPSLLLSRALLLVALLALLPPALVGHAGHGGNPVLAVTSLSLHLGAVAVWMGGLLAIVVHLRGRPDLLAVAVPRFSRIALVCVLLVATSGVIGASATGGSWEELRTSSYGLLLLVKVLLLGVLVLAGARHRRRTVGLAASGLPSALRRLAVGELVVMGAVLGAAVTLSSVAP